MVEGVWTRALAGLLGSSPITGWLIGRSKKINEIRTLICQLEEELLANKGLPRQARSQPLCKSLNEAIGNMNLSQSLREKLREINRYILSIRSFVERGIANTHTVDQVFQNQLLPQIEQALPVIAEEKARWARQRWWRPFD